MANSIHTPEKRTPFNLKLFACLLPEFQIPPDIPGVTYFPDEALFTDEEGNQRTLIDFYCKNNRVLCPLHPDKPAVGYVFEEFSCTLGFHCPACNTTSWSISHWEAPCKVCGVPISRWEAVTHGLCQNCDDYHDTISGMDFSVTDIDI
ncbi:hypothetical protein FAZ69_04420 [Trinickia terrae]|uniref:Uncharacterized protein n=1 Tax=Trinickia terrae TaxID=2571161 RepID=A0A4U1IDF4_9BURK|nr:hypothetical protein [Trinickia terrae]TKC91693.1 hypothetical protein FAZ69_04420 [Trinickia terrae]